MGEALGDYGGSSGCSARRLGIDHALAVGKKRLTVGRARLRKYKARSKSMRSVGGSAGINVSPLRIGGWGSEPFMDPPNREVVFRVRVVRDVRAKLCAR